MNDPTFVWQRKTLALLAVESAVSCPGLGRNWWRRQMPREATASSKEARLVTSHLFFVLWSSGRNRDRMDDYFVKVIFKSSQPVGVDTGPRPGTAFGANHCCSSAAPMYTLG